MSSVLADIEVHAKSAAQVDIGGYCGIITGLRCSMAVMNISKGAGHYQYWAQFVTPDLHIMPGNYGIARVVVIGPDERVDLYPGQELGFFIALTKLATGTVRSVCDSTACS